MSALPASSPFIPNQGQQSVQSAVTPAIQIANQNSGLELLMQIEADARDCTTLDELNHLIASRTKKLIGLNQTFSIEQCPTDGVASKNLPRYFGKSRCEI